MLTPWQRLGLGAVAAVVLTLIGTLGYVVIEGFSFFDAFFQTVTTITTAGFGEVEPIGTTGRAFTVVLILFGIVVILYVLGTVTQIAVEGELEALLGARRLRARIAAMRDHHIVCGFGRVGEEIGAELSERRVAFVVVENNPEAIGGARRKRYPTVVGDATRDNVLLEAGVTRARSLLAASDSDAGNTFALLAARSLNPGLFLVGRAASHESGERMLRAGASRVFSPYTIAGSHMAIAAIQPVIVEFIEATTMGQQEGRILAELEVPHIAGMDTITIEEFIGQRGSVVVLGYQRANGEVTVAPPRETRLNHGDRLIVVAEAGELEEISLGKHILARGA